MKRRERQHGTLGLQGWLFDSRLLVGGIGGKRDARASGVVSQLRRKGFGADEGNTALGADAGEAQGGSKGCPRGAKGESKTDGGEKIVSDAAISGQQGHAGVHEGLVMLLKIQDKDIKARRLKGELEEKPNEITALKKMLDDHRKRVEIFREAIKKQTADRNSLEVELDSRIQTIHKYEAQSSQVKTNEEYRALLKEIDELKKGNTLLEDKILDVMEKLEEAKSQLIMEEQSLKAEETKIAGEEKRIQEEIAGIRSRLESVLQEKETLLATVSAPLLDRYNRIFENKDDYAVVTIENGACGGCHMAITPQVMNEVKRAHDLVLCENFARILCLPPT